MFTWGDKQNCHNTKWFFQLRIWQSSCGWNLNIKEAFPCRKRYVPGGHSAGIVSQVGQAFAFSKKLYCTDIAIRFCPSVNTILHIWVCKIFNSVQVAGQVQIITILTQAKPRQRNLKMVFGNPFKHNLMNMNSSVKIHQAFFFVSGVMSKFCQLTADKTDWLTRWLYFSFHKSASCRLTSLRVVL